MNDILLTPLRISELESLIENSVRRAMNGSPAGPQQERMNAKQAAEHIGIQVSTLHGLTHRRAVPFHKGNGKHLYFFRSELEEWLRAGKPTQAQTAASERLAGMGKKKKRADG